MSYFPRHTVNIRTAEQGEFVYANSKAPYNGSIVETATGEVYAGNSSTNIGEILEKVSHEVNSKFGNNRSVRHFNFIRKQHLQQRKKLKTIFASKISPQEEDYERGYYRRYFLAKNNNLERVIEITKESYDNFKKRRSQYDHNLYSAGIITWSLEGDVYTTNFNTLEKLMEEIPGMKNAFPLLDEFYRKPEYNQGDSSKYNIPNRFYPNEEPIPVNLPPTYNLPKIQNQKFANCIFLGETKCNKWKATSDPAPATPSAFFTIFPPSISSIVLHSPRTILDLA